MVSKVQWLLVGKPHRIYDFCAEKHSSQGLYKKTIVFSDVANLIYSNGNTSGKTTFLRSIFYALGYPIPSTKGIKFEDLELWITVENRDNQYKIYRHNTYVSIDDGNMSKEYSVPTDFYEILTLLTGCNNRDILDNLIGACYMDQEKGWTLLNRGKVIGNISFNIEALVRGLSNKECSDEISQLEEVKRQLKKYEYMYSVAEYQDAIREAGEDIEFDAPDEVRDCRLEILRAEREPIVDELDQIKNILRRNKVLADYIADMKLMVQASNGEEIPVSQETLVGFIDNNELLTARREILSDELNSINRQISLLEKQKNKETQLINVQTVIEAFDANIKKISVDSIAAKRIIDQLKKERLKLQEKIRSMTKQNNDVVLELHNCISAYAKELDVGEKYVSASKDYIFTNDLKSLSGTILHKIVFSFKISYIKLIREKTGLILPIVLDSPTGREVKHDTVEKMLRIIQRDYPDHQLIVASIYDFNIVNKKKIEYRNRMLEESDLIKLD